MKFFRLTHWHAHLIAFLLALLPVQMAYAQTPSPKPVVRVFGAILLREARLPDARVLRKTLAARLGNTLAIDDMETDNDKVILLRVKGGTLLIGLIDKPVPRDELARECRFAWYWKDACQSVAVHKAHLLVTLLGTDLDDLDAALLSTQAVVAAMPDDNAIAMYRGITLNSRETFLRDADKGTRANPPFTLWVSFHITREERGNWAVSTHGMQNFSVMEIETRDTPPDVREVLALVMQTAQYLITQGPVIKDGDTIGDDKRKIPVRHAESYWNPGMTVYRIVYPK